MTGIMNLREMAIKYCTGCFSCWVKTPGECVFKDDSHEVCRSYINSDLVVFASPIIMGFTSAVLKKATDKLIPLLHPYIMFVQGECHHYSRYDRYPLMGVILEKGEDTDEEDLRIINDIYHRMAINFKTSCSFIKQTTATIEEVADAINRL